MSSSPRLNTGRAIALASMAGALLIAVYFAAFSGRPSPDVNEPEIRVQGDETSATGGPTSFAKAEGGQPGGKSDATFELDVHIWRTRDLPEIAAGTRSWMVGAGRTSTLAGSLSDGQGAVRNASVRFIHGLNEGIVVYTNDRGLYEIPALYPGAGIVEIEADRIPRTRREVQLRRDQTTSLIMSFVDFGAVRGMVSDETGEALPGVRVELDGTVVETDKSGAFFFSNVVPGNCILYFSAPGRETRRETVVLQPRQVMDFDENKFHLRKAESLVVAFDPLPLSPKPPRVLLLPADGYQGNSFPFEKIGVVSPRPGDREITIEGIPTNQWFDVYAFSDAGVANPAMRPVVLKRGDTNLSRASFSFTFKNPVTGVVVCDGTPVSEAKVTIESSDIPQGMSELLRDAGGIERIVTPVLPRVRKETASDGAGRFTIEGSGIPAPAVVVVQAQGFERRVISVKTTAPVDLGNVELKKLGREVPAQALLHFQDRARRIVRLVVDGKPQPPVEVPPGAKLEVGNLIAGPYGVRVREGGIVSFDRILTIQAGAFAIHIPNAVKPGNTGADEDDALDADTEPDEPDDPENK